MMTSPTNPIDVSDERRRGDLREILHELAAAGWKHTFERGPDTTRHGLPEHVHRWEREGAYIEITYDRGGPVDYLRYEPSPDVDFSGILIGVAWLDTASLTGLYVKAEREGIFDPEGSEEVRAA
jgi:hypothetical protein